MLFDTVESILDKSNSALVDDDYTHWPKEELLNYFNDAQKAIVLIRPDAYQKETSFKCVAGAKQSLPADGLRLIDVRVNESTGRAIVIKPREEITEYDPYWYSTSGEDEAEAFIYDERVPNVFFVYPGVTTDHQLNIVYSTTPPVALIANVTTDNASLENIYTNAIVEYILYKAHSKDFEYSEQQKAATHYQMFRTILGAKSEAETGMTPTNKE